MGKFLHGSKGAAPTLFCLIPLLLVLALPWHYAPDLIIFRTWAKAFQNTGREFYLFPTAQANIPYPPLGILFATFGIQWSDRIQLYFNGITQDAFVFRILLALVDGLSWILIYRMLLILRVRKSFAWGLLVAVLPASWAATCVWGQLDGILRFFILLSLYFIQKINPLRPASAVVYVPLSTALLWLMLFTKQQAIFAVIPATIGMIGRSFELPRPIRTLVCLSALLVSIIALGLDRVMTLPTPFVSSIFYSYFGGAVGRMTEFIAFNAFPVWVLVPHLNPGSWSGQVLFGSISVRQAAFCTSGLAATTIALTLMWRSKRPWILNFQELLVLMAAIQFVFNLFMVGIHERYLNAFYPLALLATAARVDSIGYKRLGLAVGALCMSGFFYGAFVFQTYAPLPIWTGHVLSPALMCWTQLFGGGVWFYICTFSQAPTLKGAYS